MNDVAKKTDQYLTRYEDDPYAAFANEGGPGIQGKLLTCKKGEWCAGGDTVAPGTTYLAVVPTVARGWLKWQDGVVVRADVGLVAEGFVVRHRLALGDQDKAGEPDDPWSKCYRVLLIEMAPPHGEVTFSGSSYGAELALKELCRAYSADSHLHTGAYPVVALAVKERQSKVYGKIPGPWFEVQGWATAEDVRAGKKKRAKAAKAPKEGFDEAIGDKLPNWGN